ncbi:Asp23/Gls24 family envelope stress response protein [Pseudoflavonifractor sp. 524-17]|uniref:Asp23/Gls24 family envelope stress response protein n=1 Tax=Pseudoflavonifractor sp. 524-17 TaxID=2304577 RepID=UPI00137B3FAD|nr:Asp23/Gls24 family envelope stress response protein [Pseudoflavonifractor sp. 524-17]NCE64294.1 Asp23/Gls24 family envelope stress response protein [Pseudoflavonifractor sp. 524-17]
MADAREYVSRPDELGNIHISEEVLAVIAAAATLEVEGVGSLSPNLGTDLAELLGKKSLSKGVRIAVNEGSVSVEVSIFIKYGYTIPEVANAVQKAVLSAIGNTSGLSVECVNVHVGGVVFEREAK